ncbi:MAG: AAA family ATPase [Candidatus Omnitrophica bacterium]|nr:AAA family ATPase [Candidatus Omnitrophota bacterium]
MYFKRLELVGFKSFFDKTTLHFEPGITAVVGPNGCGKSNIFDSIRWVLGEQSAKSLRGSDMQDVIFNGTDNKDALGMAEVTLAFDNRSRFFGFDHDEVAITRRLFRSGESEYLLNKNTVRLKDISDLLLGTGVGAESYSIVAQGKIDLVLSSKPEERRMVFDEASGITKYKAQKRETARKLEETEQNLLRVNDIIAEVKRQIGSLERQANKARKYKEAFEELKIKEVNQAVLQKKELIQKKDEIINQLKEMEIKETELLDLIRKQEESISVRQAELRSLEDSMMEVKNQVLNLDNLIVRNNEHVSFNKQRLIELDSNRSFLENQIEEVRVKIVSDEENLNNVRQEYEGLRKNIEEKSQVLTQREAEINSLASAIKASLDTIADTKRQIMDLASKISGTKNQIADFTNKLHVFVARKKRLETEKVKVYEEKAVTQENLSNITKEVENIKSAVNQINEKISSLKNQLQQENAFLSGVNIDIDNLEKQRLSLESHKEFLLKLKTKYEDISESMNAVIYLDKPPQENMSGLVIKIKEYSSLNEEDSARLGISGLKISGEAKPIELDTQKIDDKIAKIREILEANKGQKKAKETQIEELNNALNLLLCELRNQELALANKESSCSTITEQFSKINQEEDIIVIELNDVNREVSVIESNMLSFEGVLTGLNNEQKKCEDSIQQEESNISLNSKL